MAGWWAVLAVVSRRGPRARSRARPSAGSGRVMGALAVRGGGAGMGAAGPAGQAGGGLLAGTRASGPALRMVAGHQLRQLREAAGLTRERAGQQIRASPSKISRMENGRVSFKGRDIADLLTLYGVTGELRRAEILELARRASTPAWWAAYRDVLPGWFETYLGLEQAASVIRAFELQFVHGLFQTPEYARAVITLGHPAAPATQIDRRVSLRLHRQQLLAAPDPPQIWAVIDETALRRPLGGRRVMRAQLQHLLQAAALPQVTIQVLPFGHGGHAGVGGGFSILRFTHPALPDVVYTEQLTSALYLHTPAHTDRYRQVADRLSAEALTPAATADFLRQAISHT
jgi:transcriptional regulator with XRE-family HTH domain